MSATIFELKRFAVHDGDGIRTTVFFKGCPLRCVWCHNPEGLTALPQVAFYEHKCIGCGNCKHEGFTTEDCIGEARVLYGKKMTLDELLPKLLEDQDFYKASGGGVTLSGGECLMQADFCAELLKALKEHDIHTAVDTCGFVSKDTLEKVIPFVDMFLYDLKAYNENVHLQCTKRSNKQILENLQYLDEQGKKIEIRIPFVPDYNDGEIEAIAKFLREFQNIVRIRVLPYHNYAGSKYRALGIEHSLPTRLPTDEKLQTAKNTLASITKIACP